MKFSITARNIKISKDLKEFIEEKVSKISKYDKDIYLIEAILSKSLGL